MKNRMRKTASTVALSVMLSTCLLYVSEQIAFANANSSIPAESTNPHIAENVNLDKGKRMVMNPVSIYDEAAKILKMDTPSLMKELQVGKSLSDIARTKKISEDQLKSALRAKQSARIDEAVRSGKLTSDKANQIKEKIGTYIDRFVEKKGVFERRHGRMWLPSQDKLASRLGLTAEELRNKLMSGKSLAEIAQEKGISKDELVRSIKEDLTPMIEQMVERKMKER